MGEFGDEYNVCHPLISKVWLLQVILLGIRCGFLESLRVLLNDTQLILIGF